MISTEFIPRRVVVVALFLGGVVSCRPVQGQSPQAALDNVVKITNGFVTVGVDREKGGAITWLSWKRYPRNVVDIADPGRLIRQSYYAGASLDRTADGQPKAWSPWA
jgi:hypothetical protein